MLYASPGVVQVPLNEELATIVVKTVRRPGGSARRRPPELYDPPHLAEGAQGQDRPEGEEAEATTEGAADRRQRGGRGQLKIFCDQLGSISYDEVFSYAKSDLQTAEVVLSYYRKVYQLARWELLGRATLVSRDPTVPPRPDVIVKSSQNVDEDEDDDEDEDE